MPRARPWPSEPIPPGDHDSRAAPFPGGGFFVPGAAALCLPGFASGEGGPRDGPRDGAWAGPRKAGRGAWPEGLGRRGGAKGAGSPGGEGRQGKPGEGRGGRKGGKAGEAQGRRRKPRGVEGRPRIKAPGPQVPPINVMCLESREGQGMRLSIRPLRPAARVPEAGSAFALGGPAGLGTALFVNIQGPLGHGQKPWPLAAKAPKKRLFILTRSAIYKTT
jgi:hypothetical protein